MPESRSRHVLTFERLILYMQIGGSPLLCVKRAQLKFVFEAEFGFANKHPGPNIGIYGNAENS